MRKSNQNQINSSYIYKYKDNISYVRQILISLFMQFDFSFSTYKAYKRLGFIRFAVEMQNRLQIGS